MCELFWLYRVIFHYQRGLWAQCFFRFGLNAGKADEGAG